MDIWIEKETVWCSDLLLRGTSSSTSCPPGHFMDTNTHIERHDTMSRRSLSAQAGTQIEPLFY